MKRAHAFVRGRRKNNEGDASVAPTGKHVKQRTQRLAMPT